MKRGEYPRQKIRQQKFEKERGSIEWVTGLFFLLFLAILLSAQLQVEIYRSTSLYLEDALAASNLASAVIDIEEYGISHTVRITDPQEAYNRYVQAVKKNLNLDENWECPNKALISGPVSVERYIIYNVEETVVHVYELDAGRVRMWNGTPGYVSAPNGVAVEATGIYSELSFPVEGLFGVTVQARKGKLADVMVNDD